MEFMSSDRGMFPAIALCLAAAAMAGSAAAQGRPSSEWSFSLGAGAMYAPDYEGSDEYGVMPVPMVELSWRDRIRLSPMGLFATPFATDPFKLDVGVRYDFGRDQDDNDALTGLGDIEGGAVAVVRFGYEIGSLGFGLEVARDLGGDRDGLVAIVEAEYAMALADGRTRLSMTPHVAWADDNYMDTTFGLTAAQAARSARRYARYDAGAGIKDAGVAVGIVYALSDSISVIGRLDYSRLLGDAADSPLVNSDGSADQVFALLGVSYRW